MTKVFITDRITDPTIEREILGDHLTSSIERNVEVLLVWHQVVDESFLNDFPNLKVIIRYGVGFDKIDLNACNSRGITVCNNPDYCTEEVADTAIAMIVNSTRMVTRYNAVAPFYSSGWQENVIPEIKRTSSQTVGIIGMGRIGNLTLSKCKALGYQTQFYDPYITEGTEKVFGTSKCSSLEELLETSDIVSLHCPLDESTQGIVDSNFISKMKTGASLVNTARGGLVSDIDIFYSALESKSLSSVALDVLPQEPPQNGKLIDAWKSNETWLAGRLLINPHAAYNSIESQLEQRKNAAKNALRAIQGLPLNSVVSDVALLKVQPRT
ncbi:C-terminal binding protein [Vibrio sp. Isolate31]|uniref:C-terminal binding protein n=1 Tax=unclassified Vibrio TaxID=2614977 RepID=UPI001EFC44D6|nr:MULTISPECIES: C-terminal binding protein [unclassified Vibrio]MCG9554685.1 C-terminal binding protein [Vibrio sp. Isolate32]MCG9600073.1 C-terminal binding protein [Vibrio sp. Isolate31]